MKFSKEEETGIFLKIKILLEGRCDCRHRGGERIKVMFPEQKVVLNTHCRRKGQLSVMS